MPYEYRWVVLVLRSYFLDQRFHSPNWFKCVGKGYNKLEVNELLDRAVTETSDQEERANYSKLCLVMQDYQLS